MPTQYLDIVGTSLKGFKPEYKTKEITGYNKIMVPKSVESVTLVFNAGELAFNCIQKIDYESGSNWNTISSISSLANLKVLVFPPNLSTIGKSAVLKCPKLNTIDISNVEDVGVLIPKDKDHSWIELDDSTKYDSGTLIIKQCQADKVQAIKEKNPCLANFEVKKI